MRHSTSIILILLSIYLVIVESKSGCQDDYSLDYLKLSLQWSAGVCATSSETCQRGTDAARFTLHGFWPCRNSDPMEPSHCCFDKDFDIEKLRPILPQLRQYWYGYFGHNEIESDKQFWSHEWVKHGTCARDIPNMRGELNYFNTTLNTFLGLNILDELAKANIMPSDSKHYKTSDLIEALRPLIQAKSAQVECRFAHGDHSVPDLTALNICYDNQLNPVDCPVSEGRCLRSILMPKTV